MIQPTNAQQVYPQPSGANAVAINIYNPQAYGSAPQQAQSIPYTYDSMYQMPQTSAFQPQQAQEMYYQQYMPMQNPVMNSVQAYAPEPQVMPQSVMNQEPQEVAQNNTQNGVQENTQKVVDVDALVNGLKSTDADAKADAINQVANYVQDEPEVSLQVLTQPIIDSLIGIVNEDTTKLEGPTKEQINVAEKIAKGEQLTPEEDALSEELSPRDKANKNRIFALYTLAMLQKLQRDELDQYIEKQKANGETPIEPLKIEDLNGYNDIVNIINNDQRPEVQVAAIQALQHVARPEDKQTVENALASSLKSKNDAVKDAANEVMSKFAA